MPEEPYHEEQIDATISRRSRRERRREASKKSGGGVFEFLVILLVSFVLVFGFVRPFVVEAFWIPSASMVPTLKYGDRVLVNKFIYRFTEPERGDIIVFKSVEGGRLPQENPIGRVLDLFLDDGPDPAPRQDLIKRIVAVAEDKVSVRRGKLFVNGEPQREPFVNRRFPDRSFYAQRTVPEGHVFVMGDNRANSQDSRVFGPVPKENIEGKAFLRFWPPDRIGFL